jgi:hypothetical protein
MLFTDMKLLIFYRPNSEHARNVETFMHDFRDQYPMDAKIEIMDLDTRDGAAMATLYDVLQYPALLATTDEGVLVRSWEGQMLPLMRDVAAYLR